MAFTFVDLFAGCGGLSLGLSMAGGTGVFAIERHPEAFETLQHNLVSKDSNHRCFNWPDWLPKTAFDIKVFLKEYGENLSALKGTIDLVAGGPPCQGYSFSGARDPLDPRNSLYQEFVAVIHKIKPKFILMENVPGIGAPFLKSSGKKKARINYADLAKSALIAEGYSVSHGILDASKFGVPQRRERFFFFGIRNDLVGKVADPFQFIDDHRASFLKKYNLGKGKVSAKQALSDLSVSDKDHIPCLDRKKFFIIKYAGPRSDYQKQLRNGMGKTIAPDSMSLPKHRTKTIEQFKKIQAMAEPGSNLKKAQRDSLGILKSRIVVLGENLPSRTVTTLPDDMLHYSEPRILTVRECARLQSFPDWFQIKGKYTTGGERRKKDCPRYTQVGNAVPIRLGQFMGFVTAEANLAVEANELEENLNQA